MRRTIVAAFPGRTLAGQLDRFACHLAFGQQAFFRYLLHNMTVSIAGGKIHLAVDAILILTQDVLDNAHPLDELSPVHRSQKSEAAYAVAYGNLIGGQLLALRLHQPLDRQAGLGKPLLNPGERQRQSGALPLQPARKFRDKRTHHWRDRPRHIRDCQDQAFRVFLRDLRHLVCPVVGEVSVDPVGGDPGSNASEILDKCQTQHDRDCPQFP